MQRRTLLPALGCLCLGAVGLAGPVRAAWAQRVTNPIAGTPGQRLAGAAVIGGRFNSGGAAGPSPGVFTVQSVDSDEGTLRLLDESGASATVQVDDDIFDLDDLKPGDLVSVDFLTPDIGHTGLQAGGLWKVQR